MDDITVSGGGISHSTGFEPEARTAGFSPRHRRTGWGVAESLTQGRICPRRSLPAPAPSTTPCWPSRTPPTSTIGSRIIWPGPPDRPQGRGPCGAAGKVIRTNLYTELPLLNYIFTQFNARWYPEVCINTGKLVTSPWTSDGFIYFFGGLSGVHRKYGGHRHADRLQRGDPDRGPSKSRIALGVLSLCRFFANCTEVANTTPPVRLRGSGRLRRAGRPGLAAIDVERAAGQLPRERNAQSERARTRGLQQHPGRRPA